MSSVEMIRQNPSPSQSTSGMSLLCSMTWKAVQQAVPLKWQLLLMEDDTGEKEEKRKEQAEEEKLFMIEDEEKKQRAHAGCWGDSTQTMAFTSWCKNRPKLKCIEIY